MHQKLGFAGVLCALLLGHAANAMVVDFEGFLNDSVLTDQYPGVLFSGATVLTAPDYYSAGYPPHSGLGVACPSYDSVIRIDAIGGAWSGASVWGVSAMNGLFLEAFDDAGHLLDVDSFSGSNLGGPNRVLSVSAPDIAYLKVHDGGDFYTIDDLTLISSGSGVPEPASIWGGGAMIGLIMLRSRPGGRDRRSFNL